MTQPERTLCDWQIRPTRDRTGILVEQYLPPELTVVRLRMLLTRDAGLLVVARPEAVTVPVTVLEWALAQLAALPQADATKPR